ncbi:MAG: hypothetical protein COU68_00355 [Candidatus Pacebacteria bacterium CG10_big_fil_rev_8_21_14_0_10_45_6]|nr:MAG: hypothetical protein COU68_00355 [Candidatus Pacebacteria bacterium CG10_big_fil_rev_8_21_14_0_10_45_6]
MSYATQIITTENEYSALEGEWQELLESSATNQVFQSFSFLNTWWHTFNPGEISIIAVREEGTLVALAPLFIQKESGKTHLKLLGCINVSDYLDVLVQKKLQAELYPVLLAVIDELIWDSLEWCSLPEESPSRMWLKQFFSDATVSEKQQDVCPQIELLNTWESYLTGLDRKQRHEIRRKERRLQAFEHKFEEILQPTTTDVADFIRLHKESSREKKSFWDDTHLNFFRHVLPNLGKQGWLRLFFLSIEGTRAASMIIFDYNQQFQLYNSGFLLKEFRELGVGSLLTAHTIKRAIEEKKVRYDFLRGNEAYKFRYTNTAKPIFDITITRDRQPANQPQ